jgi:hypothetical protein
MTQSDTDVERVKSNASFDAKSSFVTCYKLWLKSIQKLRQGKLWHIMRFNAFDPAAGSAKQKPSTDTASEEGYLCFRSSHSSEPFRLMTANMIRPLSM